MWTHANERTFRQRLAHIGFEAQHVRTPVPILWPVIRHGVAHDKDGRIAISKQVLWASERDPILVIESADNPRIRAVLDTPRGRIWSWFADGMVGVELSDDGTIVLSDHRYGLYADKTFSFFKATLKPNEPIENLEMLRPSQSRKGLDIGHEWSTGWRLITGQSDDN